MKAPRIILALFLLSACSGMLTAQQNSDSQKVDSKRTITLFNGQDLKHWQFYLKDKSADPGEVFTIRNGVIHIKGEPFGYMRTMGTYSDYKLHLEWRWPGEPTNSGVFIHAGKPYKVWPRCVECQLMAGNAGDFVCMSGADMLERVDKSAVVVKKLAGSSEKAPGEWNVMEVICSGNSIAVFINEVLQNRGTEVNLQKGSICLQSEGKDIEFRNIYIQKLK